LSNWSASWGWSLPLIQSRRRFLTNAAFAGAAGLRTTLALAGAAGLVLNVVVHVLGLGFINEQIARRLPGDTDRRHFIEVLALIMGTAVLLATALHGLEGMIWAAAYLLLGALPDAKTAMLYSLSAITSYGHANIYLEPHWQ
jgi:hypothetical protein